MEAFPFMQKYLFPCLAVLGILVISFVGANFFTKREFGRRDRASAAAKTIDAEIRATYAVFEGKYMPLALRQVLKEACSAYLSLEDRSWNIRSESQFKKFAAQVAAAIDEIKATVARPFSLEEMESDRLALVAELADVEETAVAEQADAVASHAEELARIESSLERERGRIATAQVMLALMAGREKHKAWFQETFDRYLNEASAYVNGYKYVRGGDSGRQVPVCEEFMRDVEYSLHLHGNGQIRKFRADALAECNWYVVKNLTSAMPYSSHSTLGPAIEEYVFKRIVCNLK